MLFRRDTLDQIAAGRVTVAFRRWARPSVKPGGRVATAAGVLAVDKVAKVALSTLKTKDAQSAGYATRAALLAALSDEGGDVYRVEFHRVGPDPRAAPRKDGKLTKKEMKSLIAELNRLDHAGSHGPWTRTVLRLIDKYPARRPPDLAVSIGRDPLIFKRDVRNLKDLGLVEALEIGFRLSTRGRAVLNELFPPVALDVRAARPALQPRPAAFVFAPQRTTPTRSPGSGR